MTRTPSKLKGSEVGFRFRPNITEDCVNAIDLLLGKARIEKERDVTYTKVIAGFNVTRIAERALTVHMRWLVTKAQESAVHANNVEGRHAAACLMAKIYGVSPTWTGEKDKDPQYAEIKVGTDATVRVTVNATHEGVTFGLVTLAKEIDAGQLEKLMRGYMPKTK